MEKKKALYYVDEWANFYLSLFGEAKHMESHDNGCYTKIWPKQSEKGPTSIFNIRLEQLSDDDLARTVQEIKAVNCHTWWNLSYPEKIKNIIYPDGWSACTPNDWEVYSVMLPEELPAYVDSPVCVRRVESNSDFIVWTAIINDSIQKNHYHLCQNGMMRCYLGYCDDTPVSAAAILKNKGICSVEFATTLSDYRKKGFAAAVCQTAIKEAIHDGAEVITVRAYGESKLLGKKLGFIYI